MLILVINCGSSSAKYRLFDMKAKKTLKKGAIERISENSKACKGHYAAIRKIKDGLLRDKKSPIKSISEIKGIGHRVVHGGEEFSASCLIAKKTLRSIEKMIDLAPLHNPPSLAGIRACKKFFPGIPQIAVFDTAFHHTIPQYAHIYGIPFKFYKKYKIRRYGFHGTSHRYVTEEAARILKKPISKLKLISAHLGNGCSMAAVEKGKSIDTTMGLTPLEGLLMGTRSGDMDPAIVTFLMRKEGLTADAAENLLNKKSGFLGVSGISNDMRDILRAMRKGNKRARLAHDIFFYRIKKYIGAYAAVMGGVDAVILTGGIGENLPQLKNALSKDLKKFLGSKTKFMTVPTNEELMIARDVYKLVIARAR